MFEQKILKADGTEGFSIALFSILFIFFSYVLVKEFLEHSSILKLLSIFVWIIAFIIQIYLQSIKLLNSKSENTLDNQDEYQAPTTVKQLTGVIIAFIFTILLFVLLRVDFDFSFKPQYVGKPEYEPFNDCSYIALGLAFILYNLKNSFNIKKSLFRSILLLFEIILVASGLVMSLIYSTHLTEVNL